MGAEIQKLAARLSRVPEGSWLLGLSGGADSTALLQLLLPLKEAGKIRLDAVHVNHGLRGEASDEDEAFVREMCEREQVPLRVYRIDLSGRRDEAAAREGRFACFRSALEETGAQGILLAHHRDDQAETLLMRLMRGAGPEGLGGLEADSRKMGIRVMRPMLALGREEIREALRQDGIPWREDGSNGDSAYLRNAVRLELLPRMERLIPGAAGHLARAAELVAADHRALALEAEKWYGRLLRGDAVDAEGLKTVPEAVRSRVLRRWWQEKGPALEERSLSARQTEALETLVFQKRGKINLPGGFHALRTGRHLHLTGPREAVEPEVLWQGPETRWGGFCLRETESLGSPGDGKRTQEVPPGFAEGCVIRSRRPGDRIHPFGAAGSRKLQDYLTDRGIDKPWRDRIPLLCRGNEVLLAGGVGAGDVPRWTSGEARVRLSWTGEMPWAD